MRKNTRPVVQQHRKKVYRILLHPCSQHSLLHFPIFIIHAQFTGRMRSDTMRTYTLLSGIWFSMGSAVKRVPPRYTFTLHLPIWLPLWFLANRVIFCFCGCSFYNLIKLNIHQTEIMLSVMALVQVLLVFPWAASAPATRLSHKSKEQMPTNRMETLRDVQRSFLVF